MTRDPFASANTADQPLPDVSGYRLQRVIGSGGMSTVYLARQVSLEREVALKVMRPDTLIDEISRRRFENEARTIARLDHPNIVGIFDVGRSEHGLPYFAMPYLPRGHLRQRDYTRDHAKIRTVLHGLLSALDYAHARGVVHRDVKAENVLFDDADRPLLADFGIALRRGYGTRVTAAGLAVGSTAYMPPEQARGQSVDGRADLYSVGVLGWEMLTGQLPYSAGDALSMALQHAQQPIPRLPRELRHWQGFFDRALSKTPETRFPDARSMREALDAIPEHPATTGWARLARIRRQPGLWIGVAAAACIAAFGLAWDASRDLEESRLASPLPDASTPAIDEAASTQQDAVPALMRPLPASPADSRIAAAEQQLQQERWTSPAGDNAYDSLLAAAGIDVHHPRLAATATSLIEALSRQATTALEQDNASAAVDYFNHAQTLAKRTQLPAWTAEGVPKAIDDMRAAAADTLRRRIDAHPSAGRQALDTAALLSLGEPRLQRLRAAASTAPVAVAASSTAHLSLEEGWTLLRDGDRELAVADRYVSRADYERFAVATGRPTSRCRERSSLLRIVAPRDWKSPGFEQSPRQPVVCVSWKDANAYTRWLRNKDGRHYRLATLQENKAAPVTAEQGVASWSNACGRTCTRRVASGGSQPSPRVLESDRGYDDVGFRLAREM